MSNKNKFMFAFVAFLKVVGSILELFIPILISMSFDKYFESGMSSDTIMYMSFMAGSIVFAFIFNYLGNFFASINANEIVKERKRKFIEKLSTLDNLTFDNIDKSDLLTSINLDFNNYYLFIQNIQRLGIRCPILLFGSLIICITYSLRISIYLIITIAVVVILIILFSYYGVKNTRKVQYLYSDLAENSKDSYYGARQIRVYNSVEEEEEKFAKHSKSLAKFDFKTFASSNLSTFLTTVLLDGTFVLMLYISSTIINVEITLGQYLSFISLFAIISHASINFSKLVIIISRGRSAVTRIKKYEKLEPGQIKDKTGSSDSFLKVENLSFNYLDGSRFSFKDININLLEKRNIEIIGPVASGKSTLLKLIANIYSPVEGIIYLDKLPNSKHSKDKFGYVFQDDYIFENTILFNITLNRKYNEKELELALKTSESESIISKKEAGIDEFIGHKGAKLSGGEKSRILLARALLKSPDYLFLDNALSSLDYETSRKVLASIKANYPNLTIITTSERPLSTNDYYIVVKDEVEAGTYQELKENNDFFMDFVREVEKYGNQ